MTFMTGSKINYTSFRCGDEISVLLLMSGDIMIIETNNLSKQYKKMTSAKLFHKTYQQFYAVKNVSLKINYGDRVGLVGLNGSGKSTLIKMLLGILEPDAGNIKTFGVNPLENRQKNAQKIGVVFGQRSQLRWDLPAMDTFKLNQEIYQVTNDDFQKRLTELSEMLEADAFLMQPVRTLSLGQRMKAEFIAALIHNPDLLILDEPTIGLDVLSKNSIVRFLKTLTDKTIIFTSHDLSEVEEVCSKIMIMSKGELVLKKNSSEITNLAVPATITFTSKTSNLKDVQKHWPAADQLSNGQYRIKHIKPKKLKSVLSKITTNISIDSIEVKSGKLEYLLNHVSAGGDSNEV